MKKTLELLPAIDIASGQAVRLVKGLTGTETNYGSPIDQAIDFQAAGANWIHLVDLDAAFGRGDNFELLTEVIKSVDIKVELSGGIRDTKSLERALSTNCNRVNLGTAALENPDWTAEIIAQYGEKIAVGLDVKGETLAARGWVKEGGNLWEVLDRLEQAGCPRYVVTDVNRDGTLGGPNLDLLRKICEKTNRPVIASGGVSSLEDISQLRELVAIGVEGAIIGKALYAKKFELAEALRVAG
jgi:1-(5-phosphoribosyl)-5-[(5-phosphoribosylamino)methylideneamino] imidazole-4-carboxamide isomerase/N-(5'phosphoribosyl)anthranilate isomerase